MHFTRACAWKHLVYCKPGWFRSGIRRFSHHLCTYYNVSRQIASSEMAVTSERKRPTRIGIVGFGNLGKYMCERILEADTSVLQLAFVWNRTRQRVLESCNIDESLVIENLNELTRRSFDCDVIVEVAHPHVVAEHGAQFLEIADLFIGSPNALADKDVEERIRASAAAHGRRVFCAVGALWGAYDIRRMDDAGTLEGLRITMSKHPSMIQSDDEHIRSKLEEATNSDGAIVLYDGPVRALSSLAPQNVNTMAAACLAARSLGFDRVRGRLIADRSLTNWHLIDVDVDGPARESTGGKQRFRVETKRHNPAALGAVTGRATYMSIWTSIRQAASKRHYFDVGDIHLC